jgi:predicted dinucleotide-binding enzyme
MRVAVIGAGRIGGNTATQLARRGHDVTVSSSRDPAALEAVAAEMGARAVAAPDAVADADAVVLSVPWTAVEDALGVLGSLDGKVVVDTTNQYGPGGWEELETSAVERNAGLMPGAHVGKAFNTLTSAYQRDVGDGRLDGPVAMFFAAQDEEARATIAQLVQDIGFVPVELGWEHVALMEAPHRPGAVYGEAYRPDDAQAIADAAARDLGEASRLADERKLLG